MNKATNETIRVGLIRCDLHAVYYSSLIAEHDPLKLRSPRPPDYKDRYVWERGAAHFYHYTNYNDARRLTVEPVDGFEIARIWDEHREAAEIFVEVFNGKPEICDRVEQVSDDVDLVFIADCDLEGKDHFDLARPGLEKGVPTFVDKPFAYTVADVLEMLELGKRHGAPVMSLSILRSLPEATLFARRMEEIGGARFGTVQGGSTHLAGLIHSVSLAQHLFGDGVETVQQMSSRKNDTIILDYGDRQDRPSQGVVINTQVGPVPHCSFYASAFGPKGRIHSPHFDDYIFPFGAAENLKKIRRMVQTGEAQAPREEMIEAVAVAQASRISAERGEVVAVHDVIEAKIGTP